MAFQLPNRLEFVTIALGTLRAGAVCEPLMPIFRERELSFMLAESRARVLFVPDVFRGRDHAAMAAAVRPALPALEHVVVLPSGYDDMLDGTDRAALPALERDQLAQLLFTSGTSGEPKGALHRHDVLMRAADHHIAHFGLGAGDVDLRALAAGPPDRVPLRDVDRAALGRAAGAPGGVGPRGRPGRDAALRRHVRAGGHPVSGRPDARGRGARTTTRASTHLRGHRRRHPPRARPPLARGARRRGRRGLGHDRELPGLRVRARRPARAGPGAPTAARWPTSSCASSTIPAPDSPRARRATSRSTPTACSTGI